MGSPDCQGIPGAMGVFADMALFAWELAPTLAAVGEGLESEMHGVFCADLCKASRQLLPTVLSGASALAGRRGDGSLGNFRQSFT